MKSLSCASATGVVRKSKGFRGQFPPSSLRQMTVRKRGPLKSQGETTAPAFHADRRPFRCPQASATSGYSRFKRLISPLSEVHFKTLGTEGDPIHCPSTVISTASLFCYKVHTIRSCTPLSRTSIPPNPHTARCLQPLADHVSDMWSSLCMFLRRLLTTPFMLARNLSEVLRVWGNARERLT